MVSCTDGVFFYGMDQPIPMGRPEFEKSHNMKTVGLILQLTRLIWSTSKAVIMDICFCLIKGILKTRKRGVMEVHL